MNICSEHGCTVTKHEARGLCKNHYEYLRSRGELPPNPKPSDADRFASKLAYCDDGCVVYTGSGNQAGYGFFSVENNNVLAHRWAYANEYGPIPDGLYVLHKCDNPPCCNTSHLFLGTYKDNRQDCIRKGRNVVLRGEQNGRAKIGEGEVLSIRNDNRSHPKIAREYGLSTGHVRRIKLGISWAHIRLVDGNE